MSLRIDLKRNDIFFSLSRDPAGAVISLCPVAGGEIGVRYRGTGVGGVDELTAAGKEIQNLCTGKFKLKDVKQGFLHPIGGWTGMQPLRCFEL